MGKPTSPLWLLAAAALCLPALHAAEAPLAAVAQDQVFFNTGGPANAAGSAIATTSNTAAPANTATLPDPSLFTQVSNPNEQTRDHAISLFQGGTASNASSEEAAKAGLPDPALFTQTQNPNEQTRDHAFNLFGLVKKKQPQAQPSLADQLFPVDANGQPVQPAQQASVPTQTGPDPSLFTEVQNPNEQTRDHPFNLF